MKQLKANGLGNYSTNAEDNYNTTDCLMSDTAGRDSINQLDHNPI